MNIKPKGVQVLECSEPGCGRVFEVIGQGDGATKIELAHPRPASGQGDCPLHERRGHKEEQAVIPPDTKAMKLLKMARGE